MLSHDGAYGFMGVCCVTPNCLTYEIYLSFFYRF